MSADLLCTELDFIFGYLKITYKRNKPAYTIAGARQYTFYIFHDENSPMRFEEWLIADTKANTTVVHCDVCSFHPDGINRPGMRHKYDYTIADFFYNEQLMSK